MAKKRVHPEEIIGKLRHANLNGDPWLWLELATLKDTVVSALWPRN